MTITDFLNELRQETQPTRNLLARVPQPKLDWRPHEKSMTLGQLAMHVASLPGAIANLSLQPSLDVNWEIPRPSASSVEEILSKLDESVSSAATLIENMEEDSLTLPWRMMDGEREIFAIPRGALLRSILFNHWYHHRGQLTVYLRLLDVPLPSIYGATADEIPFL
ncbi:MAG TPA: DinB family protein [Candidatus Kapabacteria bacterium]|jgi:uncharacterized damage-inducible protein DinB|nr:DinB family protein [Candidatus Kapabacteria bacterium]